MRGVLLNRDQRTLQAQSEKEPPVNIRNPENTAALPQGCIPVASEGNPVQTQYRGACTAIFYRMYNALLMGAP